MCGICGFANLSAGLGAGASRELLARMNARIAHRGPDGEGFYLQDGVGLGHRRLSIIDIAGGAQPLSNEDGTITVVFNGEIYNYRELTEDLKARGHRFATRSDTEVLVHLYEEKGMEMLGKLRGMFAFALHDRRAGGGLYVVRDRFGIKPVYYGERGGGFYFASEVKPLLEAGFPVEVNRRAVHLFLQTRFAHSDETIFRGIFRLPEGTYLRWQEGNLSSHRWYPTPPHDSRKGEGSMEEGQVRFEEALSSAVSSHMISEVPVGAYLSSGVDSTVVVSEMARLTGRAIRTFCVDFKEGLSEAREAEETARLLGCEHQTILCGVEELLEIPRVVRELEEPVGDGIVVAHDLLARATREAGIKVVLTGEGADEALGGYQHLRAIIQAASWGRFVPGWLLRGPLPKLAARIPLGLIDFLAGLPLGVAAEARARLEQVLRLLPSGDLRALFDLLMAIHLPAELRELYTSEFHAEMAAAGTESFAGEPVGRTLADRVLSMSFRKWLPALNVKLDKLCMAHSIENRVPYLDHPFVELATAMPVREKIRGRTGKVPLRRVAAHRFGEKVARRKKIPFHLPLQHYLKHPKLWDLVEENLDPARVRRRGFLNPVAVRRLKEASRGGDYLVAKKMFAVVILELWFRIFIDGERV